MKIHALANIEFFGITIFIIETLVMDKVAVLLAVYNGRKWIDEQLGTILNQNNIDLHLFISVDLSTDDSFEYLKNKYGQKSNITILPYGKRYGSAGKNFYRLIKDIPVDKYNYISFADQDDIWFEDKLSHAISAMKRHNADSYSSNVIAFWEENGRKCLINKSQDQVKFDYLFEAAGPGCTYVYTSTVAKAFKKFIDKNPSAESVELHDWLIYAFCRENKYKWYIDSSVFMLYRQHESNQVGANNSLIAWKKRLFLIKNNWYKNEIIKIANLFKENNNFVRDKLDNGYKGNFLLAMNVFKLRRRLRDRVILMMLLLLNIF